MPKKGRKIDDTEKEPSELAGSDGTEKNSENDLSVDDINSIMVSGDKSSLEQLDKQKGRHFWYVVYPSEDYVKTHHPECDYDGSDGWGTAPDDWRDQLDATGLKWHTSELHDSDVNTNGRVKKPHWHVIVSWPNTTTYRTARGLCNILKSPYPKLLHSVTGAYRYARHLDNPEKHQYTNPGIAHNGWELPMDSTEVTRIKRELRDLVMLEDIREYIELLIVCESMGQEYVDVASNNTFYCRELCNSYRHNPMRVLMRYYNTLPEGEAKKTIKDRIERWSTYESESCDT